MPSFKDKRQMRIKISYIIHCRACTAPRVINLYSVALLNDNFQTRDKVDFFNVANISILEMVLTFNQWMLKHLSCHLGIPEIIYC